MSFYPLTIPLANKTTGLPITTYTDLNLRTVATPGTRVYTQLAQSGGNYTFGSVGDPILSGNYELYDTDTKLTEFGVLPIGEAGFTAGFTMTGNIDMDSNKLLNLPVPATDTEPETKGRVAGFVSSLTSLIGTYLLKAGGTMTGAINMGSNRITNLPTPGSTGDPVPLGTGDSRYIRKETGIVNFIYSQLVYYLNPKIVNDAVSLTEAVNKGQVDRLITAAMVGGNTTAIQRPVTTLYVMPSGTQEDNHIYRTLTAAQGVAESFALSDFIFLIELNGNGETGGTITDYNLLPAGSLSEFIHYAGLNKSNVIRFEDSTYTGDSSSIRTIIADCTVYFDGVSSTPVVENVHYSNVKFTGEGTAAATFNNCKFENGCEYDSTVTPTFDSSCVGVIYNSTSKRFIYIDAIYDKSNTYQLLSTSGDVQPRRQLGREAATVASASSITIANGNYCVVSGTTTILTIVTTGWTDGSIIYLYFSGACLVDTGGGNIAAVGGDFTTVAGTVYCFVLDSSTWIRVF